MGVQWQVYPRSLKPPEVAHQIASLFEAATGIWTPAHQPKSNEALAAVRPGLEALGFAVEKPGPGGVIAAPVLYGLNGKPDKVYRPDAWREADGVLVEIEAGSAVDARKVYQDLFEAWTTPAARFLCLAVMNEYVPNRKLVAGKVIRDFDRASAILDTIYANRSMEMDIDGIQLIGY